ncbi:MAG: hypothetical protein LKJ31_00435 [Atopobiaceae bacterium]|jgi:hypothetical protein|nr:hypothetical protein [Atopobiaceae bacterium]
MASMPHKRLDASSHGHHMASNSLPHDQPFLLGTPHMSKNRHGLQMEVPNSSSQTVGAGQVPIATDSESPRPIGVDPSVTGSFARLGKGEGARLTTRENAKEARDAVTIAAQSSKRLQGKARPYVGTHRKPVKTDHRLLIGIAIAAVLIVAIVFFWLSQAFTNTGQTTEEPEQVEQMQVAIDEPISYNGSIYSLTLQDDGTYALSAQDGESNQSRIICTLEGTPVQLVLYNGAFIIPENLSGSWDVIAYTIADGSMATQVTGQDGNPIGSTGQISSVQLDGSVLHITDTSGNVTDVALS